MTLIPTDSPRQSTETRSKTHRCCPRTRGPRMPRDDDEIFPSVLLSPSLSPSPILCKMRPNVPVPRQEPLRRCTSGRSRLLLRGPTAAIPLRLYEYVFLFFILFFLVAGLSPDRRDDGDVQERLGRHRRCILHGRRMRGWCGKICKCSCKCGVTITRKLSQQGSNVLELSSSI